MQTVKQYSTLRQKTANKNINTIKVQPILENDISQEVQLFSENSINEGCPSLHAPKIIPQSVNEEVKEESLPHAFLSWDSMNQQKSLKKKQKKRIDPLQERQNQNYECYKEFWKLISIHSLITKELSQVREDDQKYEKMLEIMNENKERHEDDLGYYLGIEENRKKRIRRLATEIERKHKCLLPKCPKAYGSEGSLNQHLIRKHPLIYEEWMKRITEKETQTSNKKGQIPREEKDKIRREIELIAPSLCQDDDSLMEDDSD